ncbi:hypothetical protein [Halomicrococcus sp. NG-SE-24]|uniref:hypothetical protein n=1 Tax=Halomicrococcus sp. NG-SE-24 TaxID=3436928 RepID=UPI003D99F223
MVGPISEEERTAAMMRLKVGIVSLVAVSSALVAFHGGAGPLGIVAALVFGLVVGAALTWYIGWIL